MRGVCVDSFNRPPSTSQLEALGADIRIELRDDPLFYNYVETIKDRQSIAYLWGPSTEDSVEIPNQCPLLIIGNEPDQDGDSSWTMTPTQYIALWKKVAALAPVGTPLCAAGMYYSTEFLDKVWSKLTPTPNAVNKHYPNTEQDIIAFRKYGVPVVVGETTYEGATRPQMVEWQRVLTRYTDHSFYFCWHDGMVPNMGLYTATNRPKKEYYYYKKALATV